MLDLRWPMGLMFSIVGVLITGYGLWTAADVKMYERSLGININVWWGLVLLVFGGLMLLLAYLGKKKTPDGK